MPSKNVFLSDIAEVTAGNPAPQVKEAFSAIGVPFVRMQDVGRYHLTDSLKETVDKISTDWTGVSSLRRYSAGSLLIPKSGASINLNHRALLGIDAFVVSHLAIVIPDKNKIDPKYLYYWSCAWDPRLQAQVTSLPSLPLSIIQKAIVPLPPLPEQRRIVDILDRSAAIMRLRDEAQTKIKEIIPALFIDMFGDPTTNPKGWKTSSFNDLVDTISGGTPSKERLDFWSGDVPWVSPKDMKRTLISDAQDHINENVFEETNMKLIPPQSILIVVRGMILVHSVPVALTTVPVAINQDMKAFVPKGGLNADYICWSLIVLKKTLLEKVTTAAHGTKKIDASTFDQLTLPVPPIKKQEAFSRAISAIQGVTANLSAARLLSAHLQQSLLSKEMTALNPEGLTSY
jgi:type I restriction enzyme S subunit